MAHQIKVPLVPLRNVVVFPGTIMPLFVGRNQSISALEAAMENDKQVLLVTQKDATTEDPQTKDLHAVGSLATVLQLLHLPDGTVKVLVEGMCRAQLQQVKRLTHYRIATISAQSAELAEDEPHATGELLAKMRAALEQFSEYAKKSRKVPDEAVASLRQIQQAGHLADGIASHMDLSIEQRQDLLNTYDSVERVEKLLQLIMQQTDLAEVEERVQDRVKKSVEASQRQYLLSEKLRAIQKEMGESEDGHLYDDMKMLEKKIEDASMSEEAHEKAISELKKLKSMPAMSAEATVLRNYIEWLTDVPWESKEPINNDLKQAETTLEADHYGLEKIKQRILEYLAVQGRVDKLKGPILCLVGPPGVGKTSLGQSIANATGRKFVRISLGGVRDEAEIRGHRRTYIGALPGKIIQKMAKIKCKNPLFMLDEVDKMAMDFRGDPASALLEVLDPEQNDTFSDHYLEVDYDLSDVMFIATSNSLNIPPPLLDRMEVIRLAGYTEQEKLNIAKRYLVPRQIKQNGLKSAEIKITDTAIQHVIRYYTREAGVRNLERDIAKICRKVVHEITIKKSTKNKKTNISGKNLEHYLGVKKYRYGLAEKKNQIGQVTGLAWTEVGGDLLSLEAQYVPGKGKSHFTGSLGDVMQESIQAAMTVVQTRAEKLGIDAEFFLKHDFHVHVPEGATPKDGPSAGIGMCTALVSAICQVPVFANVAMTGEITLRGEVLPIGGLKEKLLAALRGGIEHVIIPQDNERDLKEMPQDIIGQLNIHPVRWIDEVWKLALEKMPQAKKSIPQKIIQSKKTNASSRKRKR